MADPLARADYSQYQRVDVMSLVARQQQLRLLLELEPIVNQWSVRLGNGDGDQIAALRRYLMAQAEVHVGLVREVRRGWFADVEVVLVVDEFAETLHPIRRPALSSSTERRVRAEMAAALRTRRGFANR
jgi:hypothetical protein